jgi:hypothetical protein
MEMNTTTSSMRLGLDLKGLGEVVQADLRSEAFEISEWSVRSLSNKGIVNPEGLWLIEGQGRDHGVERRWSVVLKVLKRPEDAPQQAGDDWKREICVAQSGLLDQLIAVKAPRYYRVEESADEARLWMEYVDTCRTAPWEREDYAFAARQLGRWAGAWSQRPLVVQPWMNRDQHVNWYGWADPERDLRFELNQKYIQGELRQRYLRLWEDRDLFRRALDSLPHVLSHFDCQRRNLAIRCGEDGQEEVVLVDWAEFGPAPLGADLLHLVGMSAALIEYPMESLVELDAVTFSAYLDGLRDAGWKGSVEAVRLAFSAYMAVWFGLVVPSALSFWCKPETKEYSFAQFGFAGEELYVKVLPLLQYSLNYADEARNILGR